jgi:hypothetical protein
MSQSPLEQAFRQRMAEAIAELRGDDWEVVDLAGHEMPSWFRGEVLNFQPDFVARKGEELLVGEVKSRNSSELQELNALADAVAKLPNARLEVYWLGDEPENDPTRELVRTYAREAATLLKTGHITSAVVIAWTALEGALVYYAAESQAPMSAEVRTPPNAWQLLSQLYSLGYISEDDYSRLQEVRKQRNAAVHYVGTVAPNTSDIEYVLDIVDRMLSGRYTTVD